MIEVLDPTHLRVGDRLWWGEYSTHGSIDPETAAELSAQLGYAMDYQRRQFVVRFESGWSVSVIWGSLTYSDNHDHGFGRGPYTPLVECPAMVEAAILHKDHEGVQGDDVFAYLDDEQLNALLDLVEGLGTGDPLPSTYDLHE